jgi:hypothetical protein
LRRAHKDVVEFSVVRLSTRGRKKKITSIITQCGDGAVFTSEINTVTFVCGTFAQRREIQANRVFASWKKTLFSKQRKKYHNNALMATNISFNAEISIDAS